MLNKRWILGPKGYGICERGAVACIDDAPQLVAQDKLGGFAALRTYEETGTDGGERAIHFAWNYQATKFIAHRCHVKVACSERDIETIVWLRGEETNIRYTALRDFLTDTLRTRAIPHESEQNARGLLSKAFGGFMPL